MQRVEAAIEKAIFHRPNGVLITETFDLARRQAADAVKNGLIPFPVVVKDCFALKKYPTTCASMMLESYCPPFSATIVEKLIGSGGCIVGKANLDEFSMGTSSVLGHFGPVKSAVTEISIDDWLVPGGSSGGPAVAVQAGISDVSIASDTGGSTRNPAAFNGIFGLKPTYGTLSRYGLIPLVNSLDAPSILARSAEKCWEFFKITRGKDARDSTTVDFPRRTAQERPAHLRIGVPREYHNELLSNDAWKCWNHSLNCLKAAGHKIKEISLPHTKYSLACYHVISTVDITSNMARYDGVSFGHRPPEATSTNQLYAKARSEALNTVVRKRIVAGNFFLLKKFRKEFYERALRIRRIISDELRDSFQQVDVIVTPTASGCAPMYSQLRDSSFAREDDDDYFTQAANLAGIPAISVPAGISSEGLPIGVQLMSSHFQEEMLCKLGDFICFKKLS